MKKLATLLATLVLAGCANNLPYMPHAATPTDVSYCGSKLDKLIMGESEQDMRRCYLRVNEPRIFAESTNSKIYDDVNTSHGVIRITDGVVSGWSN